jgi:hypothetical protein
LKRLRPHIQQPRDTGRCSSKTTFSSQGNLRCNKSPVIAVYPSSHYAYMFPMVHRSMLHTQYLSARSFAPNAQGIMCKALNGIVTILQILQGLLFCAPRRSNMGFSTARSAQVKPPETRCLLDIRYGVCTNVEIPLVSADGPAWQQGLRRAKARVSEVRRYMIHDTRGLAIWRLGDDKALLSR